MEVVRSHLKLSFFFFRSLLLFMTNCHLDAEGPHSLAARYQSADAGRWSVALGLHNLIYLGQPLRADAASVKRVKRMSRRLDSTNRRKKRQRRTRAEKKGEIDYKRQGRING
jgi:hypothetical protein